MPEKGRAKQADPPKGGINEQRDRKRPHSPQRDVEVKKKSEGRGKEKVTRARANRD